MAHDFLGTYNNHQFARLQTFLSNQQSDVPARVAHLLAEQERIGTLVFTYDAGGNPIGYNASPTTSYIGKLMMAYEILGGDPTFDLQIRSMSQPVFLVAGSETTPAQQLSSGDILATRGLRDAASAALVQQMKAWTEDVVQYKRENIERKIRRAVDYSDQLSAEIKVLSIIMNDAKTSGSLADLTTQSTTLLSDPSYRPTYNDVNNDLHGKLTHAPFSQYDAGPNRNVDPNWVRQDGGPILPGQQSPPTNKGT
jgi:hypothetical protein